MHQGAVNSACRKTPPLRRTTRRTSDSASIDREPPFPASWAKHPAGASYVHAAPQPISTSENGQTAGAVRPDQILQPIRIMEIIMRTIAGAAAVLPPLPEATLSQQGW